MNESVYSGFGFQDKNTSNFSIHTPLQQQLPMVELVPGYTGVSKKSTT